MNKLILLTLVTLVSSFAHAEICGQLAGVRGTEVAILRMQRGRTGQETVRYVMKISEKSSAPIECDDVVQAGKDSSARVILASAKLSLGSDSRIEIAAHSGGGTSGSEGKVSILNLTYGKLRALVNRTKEANGNTVATSPVGDKSSAKAPAKSQAQDAQVKFEIKTFSAVAGVRGTDFYVSYDPNVGVTQQATIEGSVEVSQAGSAQKVLVEGGKQVSVETTPQAVLDLQERVRAGTAKAVELPKKFLVNETVKPLKVVAMGGVTREEMRRTSAAVNDDADFSSKKAVETIGAPSTWTLKREPLPDALKKLKNEY